MESVLFEASNVRFEKGDEEPEQNNEKIDSENGENVLEIEGQEESLMTGEDGLLQSCVPAKTFSRLPERNPIDMKFENITFTASLGWRKGTKKILHEVNGRFPSGQLIAIMGPSGAGKSTLLDVLSGYRISGISGDVYVNGNKRNLDAFRKLSCYITQDDRLQPLITVEENMYIAADLKLGVSVPKERKDGIITEILETLGLEKARNTTAGRLSGGQKKRLSIALELINNPLVMFLDEPTTGLDSSSCSQCVQLLQVLARQGRTIICTIHQPSASLFQLFDQVYVLAAGRCLYQGSTQNLVPFLQHVNVPCPMYHNPADYVIELACGEHGNDKIENMVKATDNGTCLDWFKHPELLVKEAKDTTMIGSKYDNTALQATPSFNQLKVLLRRGFIKTKRDRTLTYMRVVANVLVAFMLGSVYYQAGMDGSKVLDNYNLIFTILMHHMMSTMMLTILTFPNEMNILIKEHFNRWYSLKMYYTALTLVDTPISIISCFLFSGIIYFITGQPLDTTRFFMFFAISLFTVFCAQSFGLLIGAVFDVVNGTFAGPTLSVPMMMFAGFGVRLCDLPSYLYWGSYVSYLRYALEGAVDAIYGLGRETLECPEDKFCLFRYPDHFLETVGVKIGQFGNDMIALVLTLFILRGFSYVLLRWKLMAIR